MKTLLYLTSVLLLGGCIKDPQPPFPPKEPDFLMKRAVQLDIFDVEDEGHITTYTKYIDEWAYNSQRKPVSRRRYSNNFTSNDTNDIQLDRRDTLYYDNQHRVTRSETFDVHYNKIISREEFFYRGNETRIYWHNSYYTPNPMHVDTFQLTENEYVYGDTLCLRIHKGWFTGKTDTVHYVYRNGNAAYWFSPGEVNDPVGYAVYDDKKNIELTWNLPQGHLVFLLPVTGEPFPLPDRNNWIYKGQDQQSAGYRGDITYDENGLIIKTYTKDYTETTIRFEYIPARP
ncbi:hypothetical protein [Chitinophaga barathri]|uniref:DUF4595 domain-containing protein n=1 Tax=Chitinophaga barathri TaxID=1647451 RepID=A0A3N4MHC8_9BACT|nr:hypothetical protein [Chitinophaga barathri]RPD41446.1 hypothetical protein EG028_08995 [Chitinophaga barathri]